MKIKNCAFVFGLIGLFLLIMGIGFAWFGTKNLIRMWAWEKLTLKNGSEAMSKWKRPPKPISMKVYIFNVSNPEAVSEGALPIFKQIGPYVYEQYREKVNIIQLENFSLSYNLRNIIKFQQSLSGRLKETDLVTVLNAPLAGAVISVYETVPEFVGALDNVWHLFFPNQRNIFITTTVKNILFDGITIDCTSKTTEVYIACRGLESRRSSSIRKEGKIFKFSFFYAKNGTSPETYQVNQGILNLKKSAQYIGMNDVPFVSTWNNYFCDMINGSDGAQFHVLVNKNEKLYVFEKELCRSLFVEFEKEVYLKGVLLYKFSNTPSLFASPEENPENHCFCRTPLDLKVLVQDFRNIDSKDLNRNVPNICFPSGVLPLMPCVGAPIVASFPHFYLGDQSYLNYSGLNPVKELHETYIFVEPFSGITVSAFKRLQFNVELKRVSEIELASNLIDGLFPILWVEESIELSPDLFKLLRYNLIEKKVLENGTFALIGFGLFLIIIAYLVLFFTDKSIGWKGDDIEFIKPQEWQLTKPDGSDVYTDNVKAPFSIRQNLKPSENPTNANQSKKSEINHCKKKILVDNFMD